MAQVLVGVFPDRLAAENAIIGLKEAGYDPTHIGFVTRNTGEAQQVADDVGVDVGTGALTGGILGSGLGAILAATGAFVIPGVGPLLAAGILVTALAGGAAGALVGALVGLGVPHEEAKYYHRRVVEGASLVTVDAPGRELEARQIFLRNGAEDTGTTTPWQSPAERYNTQAGINAENPRAETMTPVAEPYYPQEPLAAQPTPTGIYSTTQGVYNAKNLPEHLSPDEEARALNHIEEQSRESSRSSEPLSEPEDRGSVVGPGDAVQHAGETNPFAGELSTNEQTEGTMIYEEPALGQPEPPLDAGALPPNRP